MYKREKAPKATQSAPKVKPKGSYLADNRQKKVTQLKSVVQFGDKWKTKGTDKAIKAEQEKATDAEVVDTAHHILPKGKLVDAHEKLSKADKEKIGLATTGSKQVLSKKQLKSLQFNLTLGPRPEDRSDDPGDGFDPNMASGARTPRSQALSSAWDSGTGGIDHTKLVAALEAAAAAHKANPKMDRSKWKIVGGKYQRDTT